ncbi:tape measure protein [Dongia sp.]|uniref:tape measure protein n=1 Tax=Dongia sp. TaxID=1977262 RepID=UPI0035AF202D
MSRPVARLRANIQADIAQFQTNLNRARADLARTVRSMKAMLGKMDRDFTGLGRSMQRVADISGQLRGALATIGIGLGLREVVGALVDAGLKFDRLNTQLEFVTGSVTAASQEYDYLRKVTNELGLEFDSTATAYAKFAAAAKGTAIEGQGTRDVFEAVAKAATVMQLSADDTSAIFLALSQALAKGKLSSEEFRQQMGERLPIALGVASRALGVTEAEFTKLLESGGIITSEFLPKFAAQMEKEVGDAAVKAAASASAEINRLKNAWSELLATVSSSEVTGIMARGLSRFTEDATAAWRALERLTLGVDTGNVTAVTAEIGRLYEELDGLNSKVGDPWHNQSQVLQNIELTKQKLVELIEVRARLQSDAYKPEGNNGPPPSGGTDKEAEKAAERVADRIQNLQFQLAQLSRTEIDQQIASNLQGIKPTPEQATMIAQLTREIEAFKAVAAADDAALDRAVALMNDGIKASEEQAKAIAGIYEATRTPAEAYALEVERLKDLLGGSAENQDLLNRALAQAKTEFDKASEGSTEFRDIARDAAGTLFTGFGEAVVEAENLNEALGDIVKTLAKMVVNRTAGLALDSLFNWIMPTKATGGPGSGMTLVGERGPELVNLPMGSYVNPASRTSGMMRQMVGGDQIGAPGSIVMNNTININGAGTKQQNQDMAEQMSGELQRLAKRVMREEIGNQQRVGGLSNPVAAGFGRV